MLRRSILALAVVAASSHGAWAGEVLGEWARDDGKAKVRFVACGEAVCGAVSWLKEPSDTAKIGQQVFFDMKPNGDNAWAGTAFNPEDGRNYTGKMTMTGNHLTTAGCVFGGLICKSIDWTRVR
ncbi:MAG: DUF2147 domain-containing protein [Hyphomicrobiales bacterium]|nr:DUF2147 domain-containing protein [Hyphomicrobiales bacterium]MBV8661945.1 DUF2147 domain-containing protein [Hyphomicrobiales bacterium]